MAYMYFLNSVFNNHGSTREDLFKMFLVLLGGPTGEYWPLCSTNELIEDPIAFYFPGLRRYSNQEAEEDRFTEHKIPAGYTIKLVHWFLEEVWYSVYCANQTNIFS